MKTYHEWQKKGIPFDEYVHKGDEVDYNMFKYFCEIMPTAESGPGWFLMGGAVDSEHINDNVYLLYDLYIEYDGKYFFLGPYNPKKQIFNALSIGKYPKYESAYLVALLHNWDIDESTIDRNGPVFSKGAVRLWKIKRGWQCADIIDNHYIRHRPYGSLIKALVTG